MDEFDDGTDGDGFAAADMPAFQEPVDPALEMLHRVNALPAAEAIAVIDTAMGRHVDTMANASGEMAELMAIVREHGMGALQPQRQAPLAEPVTADFSRMSDADVDRVAQAVLSREPLPLDDPFSAYVDSQIAGADAWEARDE